MAKKAAPAAPATDWQTARRYKLSVTSDEDAFSLTIWGEVGSATVTEDSSIEIIQRAMKVLANNWGKAGHLGFEFRAVNRKVTDIRTSK